jgi:hypothetical protein
METAEDAEKRGEEAKKRAPAVSGSAQARIRWGKPACLAGKGEAMKRGPSRFGG